MATRIAAATNAKPKTAAGKETAAKKATAQKTPVAPPVKCVCACSPTVLNIPIFRAVQVNPGGNAIGPAGGIDLSGYRDYRLVLRIDGPANAPFKINELYGPAGDVQQLNVDIGDGTTNQFGNSNYRRKFEVFGPKGVFLRVFNMSNGAMTVNGSLYAVK